MSHSPRKTNPGTEGETFVITMQRTQLWRYWRAMFMAAWSDTELLSWNKTLTTLGISVGGFLLQWLVGVRAFGLTLRIIATVILAYICVGTLSFLGKLVYAPVAKDQELRADLALLSSRNSGSNSIVGTIKLLGAADIPELLALGDKWAKVHDTCLRGAGDGIEVQITELTTRTVDFLRQRLDDNHAAMFKNEPPEHREIAGRGTRDKHLIGLTAAKLKKVNQIIEEQRRR